MGTIFDSAGSTTRIDVQSLQPEVGSALLLDHGVLHAGERLETELKYILRCEVLYASENCLADELEGIGDLDDYDFQRTVYSARFEPKWCSASDLEVLG